MSRIESSNYVSAIEQWLGEELQKAGIVAEVSGSRKRMPAILRKLRWRKERYKSPADLLDFWRFRIVLADETDLPRVVDILNSPSVLRVLRSKSWSILDQQLREKRKPYHAFHITYADEEGRGYEFQIFTPGEYEKQQQGDARHWVRELTVKLGIKQRFDLADIMTIPNDLAGNLARRQATLQVWKYFQVGEVRRSNETRSRKGPDYVTTHQIPFREKPHERGNYADAGALPAVGLLTKHRDFGFVKTGTVQYDDATGELMKTITKPRLDPDNIIEDGAFVEFVGDHLHPGKKDKARGTASSLIAHIALAETKNLPKRAKAGRELLVKRLQSWLKTNEVEIPAGAALRHILEGHVGQIPTSYERDVLTPLAIRYHLEGTEDLYAGLDIISAKEPDFPVWERIRTDTIKRGEERLKDYPHLATAEMARLLGLHGLDEVYLALGCDWLELPALRKARESLERKSLEAVAVKTGFLKKVVTEGTRTAEQFEIIVSLQESQPGTLLILLEAITGRFGAGLLKALDVQLRDDGVAEVRLFLDHQNLAGQSISPRDVLRELSGVRIPEPEDWPRPGYRLAIRCEFHDGRSLGAFIRDLAARKINVEIARPVEGTSQYELVVEMPVEALGTSGNPVEVMRQMLDRMTSVAWSFVQHAPISEATANAVYDLLVSRRRESLAPVFRPYRHRLPKRVSGRVDQRFLKEVQKLLSYTDKNFYMQYRSDGTPYTGHLDSVMRETIHAGVRSIQYIFGAELHDLKENGPDNIFADYEARIANLRQEPGALEPYVLTLQEDYPSLRPEALRELVDEILKTAEIIHDVVGEAQALVPKEHEQRIPVEQFLNRLIAGDLRKAQRRALDDFASLVPEAHPLLKQAFERISEQKSLQRANERFYQEFLPLIRKKIDADLAAHLAAYRDVLPSAVGLFTKKPDEAYAVMMQGVVEAGPEARTVKSNDIANNLKGIAGPAEKALFKFLRHSIPLLITESKDQDNAYLDRNRQSYLLEMVLRRAHSMGERPLKILYEDEDDQEQVNRQLIPYLERFREWVSEGRNRRLVHKDTQNTIPAFQAKLDALIQSLSPLAGPGPANESARVVDQIAHEAKEFPDREHWRAQVYESARAKGAAGVLGIIGVGKTPVFEADARFIVIHGAKESAPHQRLSLIKDSLSVKLDIAFEQTNFWRTAKTALGDRVIVLDEVVSFVNDEVDNAILDPLRTNKLPFVIANPVNREADAGLRQFCKKGGYPTFVLKPTNVQDFSAALRLVHGGFLERVGIDAEPEGTRVLHDLTGGSLSLVRLMLTPIALKAAQLSSHLISEILKSLTFDDLTGYLEPIRGRNDFLGLYWPEQLLLLEFQQPRGIEDLRAWPEDKLQQVLFLAQYGYLQKFGDSLVINGILIGQKLAEIVMRVQQRPTQLPQSA